MLDRSALVNFCWRWECCHGVEAGGPSTRRPAYHQSPISSTSQLTCPSPVPVKGSPTPFPIIDSSDPEHPCQIGGFCCGVEAGAPKDRRSAYHLSPIQQESQLICPSPSPVKGSSVSPPLTVTASCLPAFSPSITLATHNARRRHHPLGAAYSSDITGDGPTERRSPRLQSKVDSSKHNPPTAPAPPAAAHPAPEPSLDFPLTEHLWANILPDLLLPYAKFTDVSELDSVAKIQLHNDILLSQGYTISTAPECHSSNYLRTCPTGYCGLVSLAQLVHHQAHPDDPILDCSDLTSATLSCIRDVLSPLQCLFAEPPMGISVETQTLWQRLHQDPLPIISDKEDIWLPSDEFLLLASHLKLSFTYWQPVHHVHSADPASRGPACFDPDRTLLLSCYRRGRVIAGPNPALDTIPRLLSVGPAIIQTPNHYYLKDSINLENAIPLQQSIYSFLLELSDGSSEPDLLLPLPQPCSQQFHRNPHRRSAAKLAKTVSGKSKTPKQRLVRSAYMQEYSRLQRESMFSLRIGPNFFASPPIALDPSIPTRRIHPARLATYKEFIEYYQQYAGGDPRVTVLWGTRNPTSLVKILKRESLHSLLSNQVISFPMLDDFLGIVHEMDTPPTALSSLPPVMENASGLTHTVISLTLVICTTSGTPNLLPR
jgi:hypothetical protein